ncbi:sigma-54 interaction domain-containing protein [Halalkalibacter alkalisediminis]|uniref:HTH-type transcriptional regulatory protein TyrR n=1 Tax=Halalkalibacter alkalisediminis TaxID=935616 RepID=A0ABV6NHW4_9BACI|nr:sigma 54-interacting transcriptional regulator [Halalkalibacter alkalisediminis]
MQNKLKLLELELDAILTTSKDNIVITDGEGVVLKVSPNCLDIYGVDYQDMIGKTVFDLEKENILSPSITIKVLKEKKDCQIMQQTKGHRTVLATGMPVFDEDGSIIRVISFSYDLTEIEELKDNFDELQRRMGQYESKIEELQEKGNKGEIVLKSKAILQIWDLIQRISKSEATVVFLGESGVGKNVFARALHNGSDRSKESFIEVNCSAIPDSLFESEMFGFEAGSFTGAHKKGKVGMIELADRGTLFLDEIGELPLSVQAKLLKVLQEKMVTRVGGLKPRKIDFRLIASTNQNLEEMVERGEFRRDLYYRLNVIPIDIPPLRERKEDIAILIQHYVKKFNDKYGTSKQLLPLVIEHLIAYNWPGNVRELENMIERIILTSDQDAIKPSHLPLMVQQSFEDSTQDVFDASLDGEEYMSFKEALENVEKRWLKRAYRQYKTTYEMAEYLGVSQSTVVRKLQKYQLIQKCIKIPK